MTDNSGSNVTQIGNRLAAARSVKPRGNGGLPEDCPVYALGQSGTHFWFMNTLQQIVAVPLGRLNGAVIQGLFAGHDAFLRQHWPKENKDGKITGFDNVDAANALLAACKAMGMYDGTQDLVRGRGAHAGQDGDLVFNMGYALWVRNQIERVGARDDGYIYPRGNSLLPPAPHKQTDGPAGPAAVVEDMFRSWNWRHDVYPRLLLGWVALAMIGGAVPWRPHVWINAPYGSGKSMLLKFVQAIAGDLALHAEDASAPSLRIQMGNDTLAMILDETEPKPESQRLDGIIEMARLASSGGRALRGTADHQTVSFTLRSTILMASIAHPPLKSQDQSRFTILRMARHTGGKPPMYRPETLNALGRALFRRMVDRFKALPDVYEAWRDSLLEAGITNGRDADQSGMLLACADLAMWDEPRDAAERLRWAKMVVETTADARAEQLEEWQRVLQLIASSVSNTFKAGEQMTVGEIIARAARRMCIRDAESGDERRTTVDEAAEANRKLGAMGLRVVPFLDGQGREVKDDVTGDLLGYLAVANSHAALNSVVFRNTHWAARSGTSGGWKAALQEAPDTIPGRVMKLGGVATRCVLVGLNHVLDGEREGMD